MTHTIKKSVFFFILLLSSSIFSMRQIATGILSRQRVVRQGLALSTLRSMFEEGITGGALARCMVEEDAAAKVEVAVPKVDVPDPSEAQNQDAVQNQDTAQNQVSIKNPEIAHYYGEPTLFGICQDTTVCPPCHPEDQGQNRSSIPMSKVYTLREDIRSTNVFYNHLAHIEQEKQNKKVALDHAKTQISDFICHLNQISENLSHTFFDPCKPLSYDQATAKKEDLVKALQRLEREFVEKRELEIDYVVDQYHRYSALPVLNNDACTIKDCEKLCKALNQKCEVDAIKVAICKYDATIQKLEHVYQDRCKKTTTAELEQKVIPELGASQKAVARSIAQEKINLSQAKKTMVDINHQQKAFDNRSVMSKIAGFITRDHTKTHLQTVEKEANDKIIGLQKKLESLEHKNSMYLSQLACAHNVAELQKQEAKRAAEHEAQLAKEKAEQEALQAQSQLEEIVKLSQDAYLLIGDTNVELSGLQILSLHDRKQVVDLINRAAQEQKTIDDPSCCQMVQTTVEVAGSACQAYQKNYVQLGNALIDFGNTMLDCAVAFSKGLACGVQKSVQNGLHTLMHPIDSCNHLAKGVVHIANELIKSDGLLATIASDPKGSVVSFCKSIESALEQMIKNIETMSLPEISELLGEKIGSAKIDLLLFNGLLKSALIVKDIAIAKSIGLVKKVEKHLSALENFAKKEVDALSESTESLVKTAEGFEVAVNAKCSDITKKAESLHSEMSAIDKVKNTVKQILHFDKEKYRHCLNKFTENSNDIAHMFRNKTGKLKDTSETREKILNMVRDKSKCFGRDDYGIVSYSQIAKDGTQWWAEVNPNNYTIRNCGFNEAGKYRTWCKETGFKMNLLKEQK